MHSRNKWGVIYLLATGLYAIYSYALVDPNLVLSSRPGLWQMQNLMWNLGYGERLWSSWLYLMIISLMFGAYVMGLKHWSHDQGKKLLLSLILILGLSYPALSHDIYNYLFNARMVVNYGANPHVQVALDFPFDPWLKFMNNTHTPAPYAYGWTAVSLVPYALGFGHLKVTVLLFRCLMVAGLLMLLWAEKKLLPRGQKLWFWALALNPLLLIETVSNIHNDAVMMALVMWAIVAGVKAKNGHKGWWLVAISLGLMSVTIKYASVMAVVGLVIWWGSNQLKKPLSFGGSQLLAHFLPLLTSRSQRFLSWYLIWPLTFLPLTREKLIRETLILFSFTGLLAYLPYVYTGEYSPEQNLLRQIILFVPPITYLVSRWGLGRVIPEKKKA